MMLINSDAKIIKTLRIAKELTQFLFFPDKKLIINRRFPIFFVILQLINLWRY